MPTRYQLHIQRWHNCTACDLCETRQKVVLGRGCVPADVCWIGEAPGKSEDSLGAPFVGKAGHRLDEIVRHAVARFRLCPSCRGLLRLQGEEKYCSRGHRFSATEEEGLPIICAFSNLLACIPWDEEENTKVKSPPVEAVQACSPRLREFMEIADPRLIIAVGKHAEDWLTPGYRHSIKLHRSIPVVRIDHPAYIIRQSTAHQGILTRRAIVTVVAAIDKHL